MAAVLEGGGIVVGAHLLIQAHDLRDGHCSHTFRLKFGGVFLCSLQETIAKF